MYMKTKTLIHHDNKVTMQVFNWPLLRYINYIPPLTQSKYIFTQKKISQWFAVKIIIF